MASRCDKDTHKVTMEDINKVTEELVPDELRLLYDDLGIDPVKVEHCEASAGTTDTILKARAVLREWLQEKADGATCEALFDARDKILARRTGKSKPGLGEFNLTECQEQLQNLYLGPQMQVQLTPWLGDDDTREMEAIFVNLEMEKVKDLEKDKDQNSKVKHKQLKQNEDLVTLQTDTGLRVNRILIQGDAGSGKSILLNNIPYKWAKLKNTDSSQSSDSPLSQFDLVFLIKLYEIDNEHKNDSLEEIIFDQILEESLNVSQTSLKLYFQSNSKRCLFLVDGIDEHSVGILNSTTSEMSKLIYYNKIYRNSCVIASTRPDTLKNIGRNNKLHIFTKINLVGFSNKNIDEYIQKHFGTNDINQNAGLLRQLKEKRDVWDLAGNPLLLMLFCVLWYDPDQAHRNLPNTKTKLYQETISSLWKRYHNNRHDMTEEGNSSGEDEESQSGLNRYLETLGKVTLEGLLDPNQEKTLFRGNKFDKATLSLALGVGMLSREKIKSKLQKTSSVKFLHTSFQDYCSGFYLANLYLTNNEEFIECTTKMYLWAITIYRLWFCRIFGAIVFCVGCKPETSRLLTSQYLNAAESYRHAKQGRCPESTEYECLLPEFISQSEKFRSQLYPKYVSTKGEPVIDIRFLLQLSYEGQLTHEECGSLVDIAVRQSGLQDVLPLHLEFRRVRTDQTEKHMQYQLDLLKSVSDMNTGLFFSTLNSIKCIDPIEFPKFYPLIVSMLRYTKQLGRFYLNFEFVEAPQHVSDFSDMFDALADLKALHHLSLHRHNDGSHCLDISQTLKKVSHLSRFELSYFSPDRANFTSNPFGSGFYLIKVVCDMKNLLYLTLQFAITWRALKCLKSIIQQLNYLRLMYPENDGWSIYEFSSYLQKAKALNELVLAGPSLKSSISCQLDQLKHMINLKELHLFDANLGDLEAHILVEGIKTMATLDKLDLRHNPGIGLVGRTQLQSLCSLPQFKHLEIELDPFSFEMVMRQSMHLLPQSKHLVLELDPLSYEMAMKQGLQLIAQSRDLEIEFDPILYEKAMRETFHVPTESLTSQPDLQDCQCCMSKLYSSIKCALCSIKGRGKDAQDGNEEVAATSIPTSSNQTKPRITDRKRKSAPSADETTGRKQKYTSHADGSNALVFFGQSVKPESPTNFTSTKPKTATSESSGLPVQKSIQEDLSPELPVQRPITRCFNLNCCKPKTEIPEGLKRCTRCKIVSYCSRDCQRKHWKFHRSTCGKQPLTYMYFRVAGKPPI